MKLRHDEYLPGMAAKAVGHEGCVYRKTRRGWATEGERNVRTPIANLTLEPDKDDLATRRLIHAAYRHAQAKRFAAGEEVRLVACIDIYEYLDELRFKDRSRSDTVHTDGTDEEAH